ncbi:MAG TPA: PQQ-binding-like beta-propeller repeat protein, partial [Candidatus Poseidoniaceae archaeon]
TAGILQGSFNSNGGIDWERGWSFPFSTTIGDMLMDGATIYISTSRNGLYVLDTTTGTLQRQTGSIHDSLGGLDMHQANGVSTLYVGLLGTFSTAAGVQSYDVATQQFGSGQLLSGLPSDNIQGFAVSNDHVYVATQNGIGRWNMSANDWDNPLTTADG